MSTPAGIYLMTATGIEPVAVPPGSTTGGVGSGALDAHFFYPSAETTYTPGALMDDIDATNATVTFTAPESGEVWVKFSGPTVMQQAQSGITFALREGSTEIPTTRHRGEYLSTATAVANQVRLAPIVFHVTGLTPGTDHTYKVAFQKFGVGATVSTIKVGDPTVTGWGSLHTVVSASPLD